MSRLPEPYPIDCGHQWIHLVDPLTGVYDRRCLNCGEYIREPRVLPKIHPFRCLLRDVWRKSNA